MKILALNGSPRMKASSTYHMLTPILEGMEAAGAETELIHVRKLDLEACIGCYTCWVRTPGECIHKDKDSMVNAMESYNTADMVIFGTPLYHFSMSGIMKTFIDRTLPRIEPWLIPHPDIPDTTFHPERFHKPNKMMLVSPCGFPEFWHFDSLVATFKQMARMERFEYVGESCALEPKPSAAALCKVFLLAITTASVRLASKLSATTKSLKRPKLLFARIYSPAENKLSTIWLAHTGRSKWIDSRCRMRCATPSRF